MNKQERSWKSIKNLDFYAIKKSIHRFNVQKFMAGMYLAFLLKHFH